MHYHPTHRERYVVYRKGKHIATGSAEDLQLLFNMRARQLRIYLRNVVNEPDDIQMANKYQVVSLAEHTALVDAEREYAMQLEREAYERKELPEDPLLYEQMFNPDCPQLGDRIRKSKSDYYRYTRKHYVKRWKNAASEQSPILSIEEIEALERDAYLKRLEEEEVMQPVGKRCSRDKWAEQLTSIEEDHLEMKKEEARVKRESMQSRFYK
jgi:hypothetical protein